MGFLKLHVHVFFLCCVVRGWPLGVGVGVGQGEWELQWCGPEGWGARRVGGAKFRSFFSFSPTSLPLLRVISWNFGGVIEGRDLKCARLEFSGCRVKPRRPQAANIVFAPRRS